MNIFNYDTNKRKLVSIVHGFDNLCKLIEEVYSPLIKDRNRINQIDAVEHLKEKLNDLHKVYEDPLGELAKFSENKFKRYSEGYEDYEDSTELINDNLDTVPGVIKIAMPKDDPWKFRKLQSDLDIMFWRRMSDSASKYDPYTWNMIVSKMDDFLLDKVDKYYEIINFLSNYNNYSCEISRIFWEKFDERYKKELKIEDYEKQKQEYKDKIKSIDKTLEMIIEEAHSLHQSSWEDVITFLIKDRWLSFKDIEGNSNKVLHVKSDLPAPHKSIVVKAGSKYSDSLKLEKMFIDYINKKLTSKIGDYHKRQGMRKVGRLAKELGYNQVFTYPAFQPTSVNIDIKIKLPEVMFFSDKINEDYNWLVLREEYNSVKLDETLNPEIKKECLNAITEFLAYIPAITPQNISQKGKIDISSFIKSKLENKTLCLTESTKLKLYDNLKPILDCFPKGSYVFHKDAILDNFIINKREGLNNEVYTITALDWEDHGFQPLYFDLVNLLEYSNYLIPNEKEEFLKNYIKFYNLHSQKSSLKKLEYNSDFKLAYLNAVIYRSMCLTSAWSKPKRKNLRPRRDYILNRAIECIKTIKEEHNDYYNRYKINYDSLEEALKEAIATLS